MYPLYSSHSNRRNDTHASGNVGCRAHREARTHGRFYVALPSVISVTSSLYLSYSVFSPSPIPSYFSSTSVFTSLPTLISCQYLRVNLQKRTLRKKIDTSYHCGSLEI